MASRRSALPKCDCAAAWAQASALQVARANTTRREVRIMNRTSAEKGDGNATEAHPVRCDGGYIPASLHQAALVFGGADERGKEGMGRERPGFELRMVLYADEPGMVRDLDDLGQDAVGRHAREPQSHLLKPVFVVDVDLIAMAVALADDVLAVDIVHLGSASQVSRIGAEPHGAAHVAVDRALLDLVALDPFGHQADHRMVSRAELARRGILDA